ncbi:Pyridoxamine 5'-phosphate oxidase [Symmachiella macrocystis]|uniref:Pyridoxamine 5'-phosphate oxidase n=1 Tax=Symmachiella macrocystis TaxID=2527985 RepID=A0A5C6B511_9PLAN|nr:pyridoxamine 5'-phosphate oxidase family protein [Symmachiella macrocystis]TWU07253.1 Pyridoxamine 5'-phosphate oxidase [Symmachiella macrocystis]
MSRKYTELTFTESVKQAQTRYGARSQAARMEEMDVVDDRLSEREAEFIHQRDGFYMATVGDDGWPYMQFRGGPRGFLKVLDDRTLAFADFRGNRQYISTGNLAHDDRVSLFFMDYANRRRLKIMARANVVDAEENPELLSQVEGPTYRARIERVVVYMIEAFDWNCPQHITPRYTLDELAMLEQTAVS